MRVLVIIMGVFLVGCSSVNSYRPLVDLKGVDRAQYQVDLEECRDYGEQVSSLGQGLIGAAVGTLGGVVANWGLGKTLGSPLGLGVGAGTGAIIGTTKGYASQITVIDTCLVGRKYKLLKPGFDYF
jgi:outer membrane lipoprotein SlyB